MNVTVEIERRTASRRPEWVCPVVPPERTTRRGAREPLVCPHCGHHLRIGARERIRQLADEGTFRELLEPC